MYGSLKHIDT